MVDDELPPNEGADPVVPPGPRRSTYTPPPSGASYDPSATDDDALAGALTQEFARWAPPTGPVPTSSVPTPSVPTSSVPTPPTPIPVVVPSSPIEAVQPVPPPPVSAPPGAVPPPPARESLTDEQLLEVADLDAPDVDTAALLDLVERELELRQAEARRLAEWEQQVRAADVPAADEIVSQVRAQFTGVIPVVPATPAAPSIAEQLASAPPPASVASVPFADPVPEPPAPPVAPPSAPVIDLALADAPPPYGIVPSAVVPPPLDAVVDDAAVPELVEPVAPVSGPLDAAAPGAAALLFDDLLREPDPAPDLDSAPGASAPPLPSATDDGIAALLGGLDSGAAEAVAPDGALPADAAIDSGAIDSSAVDHAGAAPVSPEATPGAAAAVQAPPVGPRAGRVEVSALEPTPADQRAGRSIRLFWLWFAVNASVVSVALGGVIVGLGVSLRQAVLATLLGVAISFLPLGLGTLAGKWSGQPTMVVSRATFGIRGNLLPALLAVVTRLAWSAALLWMLAAGVAEVLVGSGLVAGFGRLELTIGGAALGLVLAALIAGFGFGLIAVVSAVVSALSAVLVVGLIVLTASYLDLDAALSVPDGDWQLLVSGAVLVFSVVGLAWANSSGDLARYQAKGTYGSSAVLFTAFGATIPAFTLICWGALLAASNPVLAEGLQSNPIDLVSRLLPLWYPVPLIAAVALSLISAAALALYSGGFALLASGLRAPRPVGVTITVVLTGALVAVLVLLVPDVAALFRDIVTTLAVPVAAWAGIFGAETMIRTRRVHSPSLLRSGGVYPAVRWVNLVMLLVITAAGWGLSTATVAGLQWQGYLFAVLGVDAESSLAVADPGVLVALLLGLLTPIIAGIPALRRLQSAERAAADADAASVLDRPLRAEEPSPVPFDRAPQA